MNIQFLLHISSFLKIVRLCNWNYLLIIYPFHLACTARRSNQSILKEINPGCSLEGLMLKLKLQYFGHLMWRANSFEKTLMLGKIVGRRRRDDRGWGSWMASSTLWTWIWVDSGSWWWTGRPGCCSSCGRQESDMTEWLNWTEPLLLGLGGNPMYSILLFT